MSSYGIQRVQLERERREQLRLERARSQCRSLAQACEEAVLSVREPAVQQLAREGLQRVQQRLQGAAQQVDVSPDQALEEILTIQRDLNHTIAEAEAAAHEWSRQQTESQARIEQVAQLVQAEQASATKSGQEILAQAGKKLAQARSLHEVARYDEAQAICGEAAALAKEAAEASLDETVRREVVRGLLATLKDMGFTVQGPKLRAEGAEGGIVVLAGKLPSGKKARFEVHLDGRMRFNMDGYEGRSCGKDLERIRKTLRDRFAVKMTPQQVTWKNPDKISKGALDLPAGGQSIAS